MIILDPNTEYWKQKHICQTNRYKILEEGKFELSRFVIASYKWI